MNAAIITMGIFALGLAIGLLFGVGAGWLFFKGHKSTKQVININGGETIIEFDGYVENLTAIGRNK